MTTEPDHITAREFNDVRRERDELRAENERLRALVQLVRIYFDPSITSGREHIAREVAEALRKEFGTLVS